MKPFLVALAMTAAASAAAQEPAEKARKLEWGIGGGAVASPRPYVEAKPRIFPIPVVNLRYDRWFVQGIRGGYELVAKPKLSLNAFAQARFQGLEPDESPFLEGMEERKKSMDAGLEAVYRGRPVGFRAAVLTDTLGRSQGQELSAQAVTGAPLGKKLLVLVAFGPRWETSRRADYYYGVRPEEATSERPAYSAEDALNWDLAVSAIYRPADRWSVFALVNRIALGDAIRNSPIVERESMTGLLFFVTREF
jgi:outer membrane protein